MLLYYEKRVKRAMTMIRNLHARILFLLVFEYFYKYILRIYLQNLGI